MTDTSLPKDFFSPKCSCCDREIASTTNTSTARAVTDCNACGAPVCCFCAESGADVLCTGCAETYEKELCK